ncbi:hypothetical protein ACU7M0_38935, partial [Burkholderia cenocepacia]
LHWAFHRWFTSFVLGALISACIPQAHGVRTGTSYVSPFPPVSKAEAAAMLGILEKYLPIARALTGMS